MAKLEDLKRGAVVKGVRPADTVTVIDIRWHGSAMVEMTFRLPDGTTDSALLGRDQEIGLQVTQPWLPWAFDSDGDLFKLAAEAHRIRLAHLFDPYMAIHSSFVDPLPHQISAVYEHLLPRQPLRFLLADDPGAGKTIMAGLFMRELMLRGDLRRCLIICPGSLVDNWLAEMDEKFHLNFETITRERLHDSSTGNPFVAYNFVISRLDQTSRSDKFRALLNEERVEWDLVIVDEAHKMSASYYGNELKRTKRYELGMELGAKTRNLLLMTATPHNGKESDFQLFLALLDGDRFEGRFRDGVHAADPSDMMRRQVKEELRKFDNTPLFPERRAYTVEYRLSPLEAQLYEAVTAYVREEMNRADRIADEEGKKPKNVVGFALTVLQRRLASSPEAIYQSLKRRRERLEQRLREEKVAHRAAQDKIDLTKDLPQIGDEEDLEDFEDAPEKEQEEQADRVIDLASAARTVAELEAEIAKLKELEDLAHRVRRSGTDKKWEELSSLLQQGDEMFDDHGVRRKLIVFTEHKDTLKYLVEKIRNLVGKPETVVTIHGGLGREERRKTQEAFTQQKEVHLLVATDAAGEGINLQRAHLMINYDLPWNPNRLEQRFGRIHRIKQTEVCHLWNLVAPETREGDVYKQLLRKIEGECKALQGRVFEILGKMTFDNKPLRELLIDAIRYGDKPEVKARLTKQMDEALDNKHLQDLYEERALARDAMDSSRIQKIREAMERAEARKLQPHFIASFFKESFTRLGGAIREREEGRYEITHVPAAIRDRDRITGRGQVVLTHYERVAFKKDLVNVQGKAMAAFLCPGHPLFDATVDLILERNKDLLRRGTVLVDPADPGKEPRVLFFLEHTVRDGRPTRTGQPNITSRRLEFLEISREGIPLRAGYAPYLSYRPLTPEERKGVEATLKADWLRGPLEERVLSFAAEHLAPAHFREIKEDREQHVKKVMAAVHERLTKEITFWDNRATELQLQEQAGKQPKMNSARARERRDTLQARFDKRMQELAQERALSMGPPVVIGGALVIPAGLLAPPEVTAKEEIGEASGLGRDEVERLAMQAVMEVERRLGRQPRDMSKEKLGYDIESRDPKAAKLLFIEVKGRDAAANTVTVTKNEILTSLNKPDAFILAIVQVDKSGPRPARYLRRPFEKELEFGVTSINFDIAQLLSRAGEPR